MLAEPKFAATGEGGEGEEPPEGVLGEEEEEEEEDDDAEEEDEEAAEDDDEEAGRADDEDVEEDVAGEEADQDDDDNDDDDDDDDDGDEETGNEEEMTAENDRPDVKLEEEMDERKIIIENCSSRIDGDEECNSPAAILQSELATASSESLSSPPAPAAAAAAIEASAMVEDVVVNSLMNNNDTSSPCNRTTASITTMEDDEDDNVVKKEGSSHCSSPASTRTTPPPPILKRCSSSSESLNSAEEDGSSSLMRPNFHPLAPRLSPMMPNPLLIASPAIIQAAPPPPAYTRPPTIISPMSLVDAEEDNTVLDFSTKKSSESRDDDCSSSPVLNLSKSAGPISPVDSLISNGPLDLSVGRSRKRDYEDSCCSNNSSSSSSGLAVLSYPPIKKQPPRVPASPISPWSAAAPPPLATYQIPYFSPSGYKSEMQQQHHHHHHNRHHHNSAAATTTTANLVDPSMWNGKVKIPEKSPFGIPLTPTDATKALEKMNELSKLNNDEFRPVIAAPPTVSNVSGGGGGNISSGRHSAWQSHWLNKGAEQAKDVLKCVWCKQSFPSLAAMTTHMQEAKHCAVNISNMSSSTATSSIGGGSQLSTTSGGGGGGINSVQQQMPNVLGSPSSSKSSSSDLNLLIKETMPLPRKLVRGQDVWLGKGAEQTRQILKCMWCGQSFRSLAEMTSHMQQTQHYTNIISQEQIISWKSSEESKSSSSSSNVGNNGGAATGGSGNNSNTSSSGSNSQQQQHANANSHVSAVLTCKVCDQAFSSLKELSNHMVKNSHYKEHIMRSITESGGRRRQTREKRKKSLPVRKLLELERAQNELKNGGDNNNMMMMMMMNKAGIGGAAAGLHSSMSSSSMAAGGGRLTCDKCGEKVDMSLFVDHLRMCVGNLSNMTTAAANLVAAEEKKNLLKTALMTYNNSNNNSQQQQLMVDYAMENHHHHHHHHARKNDYRKFNKEPSSSSTVVSNNSPHHQRTSPVTASDLSINKHSAGKDGKNSSSPSVLNAIEKLIEKSFDPRSRQGVAGHSTGGTHGGGGNGAAAGTTPIGSSILKRLGIDESVDYTKPLMDVHLQNAAKAYLGSSVTAAGNPFVNSHHSHHHHHHHDQNYYSTGAVSRRERSGSESSSVSERGSSRPESLTPDRKYDIADRTNLSSSPRITPERRAMSIPLSSPAVKKDHREITVKKEPKDDPDDIDDTIDDPEVKKELLESCNEDGEEDNKKDVFRAKRSSREATVTPTSGGTRPASSSDEQDNVVVGEDLSSSRRSHRSESSPTDRISASPSTTIGSPSSERSLTPRSSSEKKSTIGSLGALSSMFDSLSGGAANNNGSSDATGASQSGSNKTSSHPLAALQKLCDKTDTTHHTTTGGNGGRTSSSGAASSTSRNHSPSSSGGAAVHSSSGHNSAAVTVAVTNPGAILAFSWACNDAVVTDSIMKCAFCDTPFISKGAYRHHLSKMHFVKDGIIPDPVGTAVVMKSSQHHNSNNNNNSLSSSTSVNNNNTTSSGKSASNSSSAAMLTTENNNNNNKISAGSSTSPIMKSPQRSNAYDESPHSKFLKYTELAKQLSSKYV